MSHSEDWDLLAARIAEFKGASDAYAAYRSLEKDTRGVLAELNREARELVNALGDYQARHAATLPRAAATSWNGCFSLA